MALILCSCLEIVRPEKRTANFEILPESAGAGKHENIGGFRSMATRAVIGIIFTRGREEATPGNRLRHVRRGDERSTTAQCRRSSIAARLPSKGERAVDLDTTNDFLYIL
jgi:hypothetical protein